MINLHTLQANPSLRSALLLFLFSVLFMPFSLHAEDSASEAASVPTDERVQAVDSIKQSVLSKQESEEQKALAAQQKAAAEIEKELRLVSPLLANRHEEDLRTHIMLMFQSPHAVGSDPRTPAGKARANGIEGEFCFACHGNNFEHFFKIGVDTTANQVNSTCLGCHAGGDRMHWSGGPHEMGNMACIDCHRMHNKNERLLRTTTQLELCSSCHQERRADFNRPYHHPVKEGQVTCTDCHNPHGTISPRLQRGSDFNETCYQCHAEKRGPFMWEHEPVREACINCHNPHGSVNPAMLQARPAQLCQSCHLTDNSHPADLQGFKPNEIMQAGKGCVNCHSQIHGSNHPGGSFFRQ